MSIDDEFNKFFGSITSLRMDINDLEDWCNKYKSFNYPAWTTKGGNKIKLGEMSDSHLENTIKLVSRKDPTNTWLKVLNQEKLYREYTKKLPKLKQELTRLEEISDMIY